MELWAPAFFTASIFLVIYINGEALSAAGGESEHPHTTWPPPCHQFAAPLLNNVAPHAARPLASCSTPRRVKIIAQEKLRRSSFLKKEGRRLRPQH